MSHRDRCPSRWEAERQGTRAFENGSGSYRNPYRDEGFNREHCKEAERSWSDGFRSAERRAEEKAHEDQQERQRERRRQEQFEYERDQEMAYQAEIEAQQPDDEAVP